MDPVETGLACGSDTAHMNIFGYNPFLHYRGRGSFEVMGSGIHMQKGEIGFKSNFAFMDQSGVVIRRRADSIRVFIQGNF
jgi:2,3-bisphosphoglycerate-independent phosphoglycerate mutase